MEWYPAATSTAFTANGLVYFNGSGAIIPADSTSGDHIGVIQKAITSASAEYSVSTPVMVEKAYEDNIYEADVTGTLTTAMVGNQYDLSDSVTVNCAAQSKKVVTCVGFISATKGLFKINAVIENDNVATT